MKNLITILTVALANVSLAYAAPTQETFDSSDAAVAALSKAANDQDLNALTKIFGDKFISEIRSGDQVADKLHVEQLAQRMNQGQQVVASNNGLYTLELGKTRWPFPAPLVERDNRWSFNTTLGAEEVINRRIGENEIRAVKIAHFYVDAQNLYHTKDRDGDGTIEFAKKLLSTPDKKDGLYWEDTYQDPSPFGPIVARAISEGYSTTKKAGTPYQGYFYKILTKQGAAAKSGTKNYVNNAGKMTDGFGLLAYPARWGVGGIMSFIVNQDGVVYEKNLGANTVRAASKISEFNPDNTWAAVKDDI